MGISKATLQGNNQMKLNVALIKLSLQFSSDVSLKTDLWHDKCSIESHKERKNGSMKMSAGANPVG